MRCFDILAQVAPRALPNYTRAFDQGDALLDNAGLNTPIRVSHFLAQAMEETGGGTVLAENLSYSTGARLLQIFGQGNHSAAIRPEEVPALLQNPQGLAERVYGLGNPPKARELGNTRPGDGFLFRGRGVLQTTGGAAYRKLDLGPGQDAYADPDLVLDPSYALLPAVAEWTAGGLNTLADENNLEAITRAINGGFNGIEDRRQWFDRIWPVASGGAAPAWQAGASSDDVRWLQQSLDQIGADPAILVDGRTGPATEAAVRWFQGVAGIPVDGVAGPVTIAALRLRLAGT